MEVEVAFAGRRRKVAFAGATYPRFEDVPRTRTDGADLPPETVLRVNWDRLSFYGRDGWLGPIQIDIRQKPSTGRVHSLANRAFDFKGSWLYRGDTIDSTAFFPAHNENHLYFDLVLPRLRLGFRNIEPVINGAIINSIPPDAVEYQLKAPVRFAANNAWMPFDVTIEKCRMAMSILKDISLEVAEFSKIGDRQARLIVRARNESQWDSVALNVIGDSSSNIVGRTLPQYIKLKREVAEISMTLDARQAMPPGVIVVAFVLVEPFESMGSNRLTVDYDEIRLGRIDSGAPLFTERGLVRSELQFEPG